MAKRCEICRKAPVVGNRISHAHKVSKRRWEPNLQKIRVQANGGTRRMRVCTQCIRSGKVKKAMRGGSGEKTEAAASS
ncbi:MAG: 50S ribosomal protein L28 [Nitrospinota bacterium]